MLSAEIGCRGPCRVDEPQALHAGVVQPPEGKPAGPDGPDGKIQGSRGSPARMRDMDASKGHYNKIRTAHNRMLLRSLEPGASRRTTACSPTKTSPSELDVRVSKNPC